MSVDTHEKTTASEDWGTRLSLNISVDNGKWGPDVRYTSLEREDQTLMSQTLTPWNFAHFMHGNVCSLAFCILQKGCYLLIYVWDLYQWPPFKQFDRQTDGRRAKETQRPSIVFNHAPFLEQLLCCFATIKKFNSDEVAAKADNQITVWRVCREKSISGQTIYAELSPTIAGCPALASLKAELLVLMSSRLIIYRGRLRDCCM